jgi:hypothetical protein
MTTTELDQRAQLAAIMGRVERQADTDMRTKLLATIDARVEQEGTFSALVACFGNVDRGGDRILPGAFTHSLPTGAHPASASRSSGTTRPGTPP